MPVLHEASLDLETALVPNSRLLDYSRLSSRLSRVSLMRDSCLREFLLARRAQKNELPSSSLTKRKEIKHVWLHGNRQRVKWICLILLRICMWNVAVGQARQLGASIARSNLDSPLILTTTVNHCVASDGGAGFFIHFHWGQRGPKVDELEVGSGGGATPGPLKVLLHLCR